MKPRQFLASFLAVSLAGGGFAPSAAAAPAAAAAAAGASIGVAGAVKGYVQVMPSRERKSAGRVISSGKPLYVNEHVTTGPGGHLQIMLLDETVFTIGPNSEIVLDEFVYNPETDSGKVTASVTKGVFRFITGNIGKKDPSRMEVKLPAGTIGIRGTIVAGQVNADGSGMAVLLGPGPATTSGARVGAFNLSNSAGSVFVEKPGFGSTLQGGGAPPTTPALIPAEQMKVLLGDLAPKTVSQRTEETKQMMAERLAQKMAADADGPEPGQGGEEGARGMTDAERKIADKMMSGEPLSPEEQAQARQGMEKNMSEAERTIAEKMMAGENLTPDEQQKMGMMMAGEQMMEHMGAENMTPEQRLLAEKMMAGNMSPEQQQEMMLRMSPEQQALMGEMMPPPGMESYQFEGGDPNAMMGYPRGEYGGDPGAEFSPYGGIDTYLGTPEFFNSFYDPSKDPNYNGGLNLPPGTEDVPNGPTTWEKIRSQVVTGTGYFPAQSGAFTLNSCNGGACTGTAGTWGFSSINVNFGTKMINGTANITGVSADGVAAINDTTAFSKDFSSLTGGAMISVAKSVVDSGVGSANYNFGIGNGGGVPASVLVGNADYMNPNGGNPNAGSGAQLTSIMVGP